MENETKQKMNWENLRHGKCPKCGSRLQESKNAYAMVCAKIDDFDNPCNFAIKKEKLNKIVDDIEKTLLK